MQVKIKRVDNSLPLPKYHSPGAAAFDLYSRLEVIVAAQSLQRIPSNLIIQVPPGYMLYIKDRSSTAKKGLLATAGIIDSDFCGDEDEILFQVYNYTRADIAIERGQRIAQGVFVRIAMAEWAEIEGTIQKHSRGGFGSTGLLATP